MQTASDEGELSAWSDILSALLAFAFVRIADAFFCGMEAERSERWRGEDTTNGSPQPRNTGKSRVQDSGIRPDSGYTGNFSRAHQSRDRRQREVISKRGHYDGHAHLERQGLRVDGERVLVVPENGVIPSVLPEGVVVLQKPVKNIYLAATSAMALFDSLGALDFIRLTGTDVSGWYIENAKAAMEKGDILVAGKYSEPDFELLLRENCGLAIESTMILHSPNVKEMIELLKIPVLIDRSSYEPHPLGRTEWIKLYGVIVGREKEAEAFFDDQAAISGVLVGADFRGVRGIAFKRRLYTAFV